MVVGVESMDMNMNHASHDHEYTTLHDMMDTDTGLDTAPTYTQIDIPAGKPDSTTQPSLFSPPLPAIPSTRESTVSSSIDLDSSVSNLSWLHSMQAASQEHQVSMSNANPNLLVNPQTVSPVSQTSLRIVTLPNNIHISNTSGNIKYVTVPSQSKQHVYISSTKPGLSPLSRYPRTYTSPNTTPSSTVPDNPYPKPAYSYSCLIALSLKNSRHGSLPVAEIYNFMMTNFPYFKTAPDGWKNSVRHNLSLNKCFEKIENPNADGTHSRKGCLWAMNPAKIKKMDEEVAKWNKKDLIAIKRSMANPDLLDILTKGQGAYLMEKQQPLRTHGNYHMGSHMTSRPGVRIVTALPPQVHHNNNNNTTTHNLNHIIGHNQSMERSSIDSIDFNRLAEDAADLFGDSDLALDPSLSDLAQNGMLEEFSSDLFDCSLLSTTPSNNNYHSYKSLTSPISSPAKNQMYNTSSVLPIY